MFYQNFNKDFRVGGTLTDDFTTSVQTARIAKTINH